jgi:hypothetical protein
LKLKIDENLPGDCAVLSAMLAIKRIQWPMSVWQEQTIQ